jgi:hypothetical protein
LLVLKPAVCFLTTELLTSSAMEHARWGRGVGIGASAEEVASEEELGVCCVSSQLRVCSSWAVVGYCAGARRSNASRRDS